MAVVDAEAKMKIAQLRAIGYSTKEIAQKLGLKPSTVSYHIQKMKSFAQEIGDDDEAFEKILLGAVVGAGAVGLGILLGKLMSK